jgi:hypothetical protein
MATASTLPRTGMPFNEKLEAFLLANPASHADQVSNRYHLKPPTFGTTFSSC